MKKVLFLLLALFLITGTAYAVPIQISGGSLTVNWDTGFNLGPVGYTPTYMSKAVDVGIDQTKDFTFGVIQIPTSLGTGTANFTVEFFTPDTTGVGGEADFFVFSIARFFAFGSLDFGNPQTVGYTYAGPDELYGGTLTVAFDDVSGFQCGDTLSITGTIKNNSETDIAPASVPEPASMLLLGTGMVGLAGASRRKLFKKS